MGRHHVRKILALADIYHADAVAAPSPTVAPSRPSTPGVEAALFQAVIIGGRIRVHHQHPRGRALALPEPGPLQLTRRHDLLDIDIAPPDLNSYEVDDHDPE
jgi:hypothetical protein